MDHVRLVFTFSCLLNGSCLIYVISVCLPISLLVLFCSESVIVLQVSQELYIHYAFHVKMVLSYLVLLCCILWVWCPVQFLLKKNPMLFVPILHYMCHIWC